MNRNLSAKIFSHFSPSLLAVIVLIHSARPLAAELPPSLKTEQEQQDRDLLDRFSDAKEESDKTYLAILFYAHITGRAAIMGEPIDGVFARLDVDGKKAWSLITESLSIASEFERSLSPEEVSQLEVGSLAGVGLKGVFLNPFYTGSPLGECIPREEMFSRLGLSPDKAPLMMLFSSLWMRNLRIGAFPEQAEHLIEIASRRGMPNEKLLRLKNLYKAIARHVEDEEHRTIREKGDERLLRQASYIVGSEQAARSSMLKFYELFPECVLSGSVSRYQEGLNEVAARVKGERIAAALKSAQAKGLRTINPDRLPESLSLKAEELLDPWGRPYQVGIESVAVIRSYGKDGNVNGLTAHNDDIIIYSDPLPALSNQAECAPGSGQKNEDSGMLNKHGALAPSGSPERIPEVVLETKILKSDFDAMRTDKSKQISQFRSVPYFRDGKSVGVRVFAVKTGGLVDRLLIRNGDIVRSINGETVSGSEEFFQFITSADFPKSIQFERNGLLHSRTITLTE